ncbi:MAG: MarR family winged helix-turn-helix transcriptional regulator [bacterium]
MANRPQASLEMRRYAEVELRCACGNLRRAARVITQFYDRSLRPSGLKTTQFGLLLAIGKLGPVPMTRLARESLLDRTTCTRNLRVLEQSSLIACEPVEDRRVKRIVLTAKGRQALGKAMPLWEKAQDHVIGKFGQERIDHLLRELSRVASVTKKG